MASVWMENVFAWAMVIILATTANTSGHAKHLEATMVTFGQLGPILMVKKFLPMIVLHTYTKVVSIQHYKKMKLLFWPTQAHDGLLW
jgi:nicotinamide riboside transporter PnuC